jgi:uncharacterized protein YcnI
MMRVRVGRLTGHAAVVLAAVTGMGLVLAAPAGAHVAVSADNPQAGARDVTLTFVGEAESDSAGIVSERVVLPDGITAADVSLVEAPPGWELTADSDPEGFTVAGPALPVGADATFQVMVAQLPTDATTLAFRTVETYSDGTVARWIEIAQDGDEPEFPAPTLTLSPAETPASPSLPAATLSPTPPTATASAAATPNGRAAPVDTEPARLWPWWIAAAAVAAVTVGAVLLARRRRSAGGADRTDQ